MGLQHEKDIEMLRDYFLPYATCTLCTKSGPDGKISSGTKDHTLEENAPGTGTSEMQPELHTMETQDILGSEHATVSSAFTSSDPSIKKFKDTPSSKAGITKYFSIFFKTLKKILSIINL